MSQIKLSLKQAKIRFASTGECFHDENHESEFTIPNTNVVQICCSACNYVKERFYR